MNFIRNKHIVSVLGADIPTIFKHQELKDALAVELAKSFGKMIEVEFVNILDKQIEKYMHLWPYIVRSRLPLILVNGEPLCDGRIPRNEIVHALAARIRPIRPSLLPVIPPVRPLVPRAK